MRNDLGLEQRYLNALLQSITDQYESFLIGDRRINAPSLELKLIQIWISDCLRSSMKLDSPYVTAYEPKCSIYKNALVHRENAHFLNMDIKDFFTSCTFDMVKDLISKIQIKHADGSIISIDENDAETLATLACYEGSLPMGAPSSPTIANRIMLSVDEKIVDFLNGSYAYSRYSDDITISSGTWIDDSVIVRIEEILSEAGFHLNPKKTSLAGKGNARKVTGVYITPDGKLSIGSKRKKDIKKKLYSYLIKNEGRSSELLGLINFAIQIEPLWVAGLLNKYSHYGNAKFIGVMGALKGN